MHEMLSCIESSVNNLYKSGLIETLISIDSDTSLFGGNAGLDSMAFVALISDLEEVINRKTGGDIYIVLTDLEEMYPNEKSLTVGMLANYLISLIKA